MRSSSFTYNNGVWRTLPDLRPIVTNTSTGAPSHLAPIRPRVWRSVPAWIRPHARPMGPDRAA